MTSVTSANEDVESHDTPSAPYNADASPQVATVNPAAKKHRGSWLQAGRRTPLGRHFSWRLLLLRFLANAVALAVAVVVVPDVWFAGDYRILSWLGISAVFGLLNAFVKPIVQVVMLPFMFVSFGLIVILINAVMLWFLDVLVPARFQVESVGWALLGGLIFSIVAGFLENNLGLTPPIFEGEPKDVRDEIERRKRGIIEAQILAAATGPIGRNHSAASRPNEEERPREAEGDDATGAHRPQAATPAAAAAPETPAPAAAVPAVPSPPLAGERATALPEAEDEVTLTFPSPLVAPEPVAVPEEQTAATPAPWSPAPAPDAAPTPPACDPAQPSPDDDAASPGRARDSASGSLP